MTGYGRMDTTQDEKEKQTNSRRRFCMSMLAFRAAFYRVHIYDWKTVVYRALVSLSRARTGQTAIVMYER